MFYLKNDPFHLPLAMEQVFHCGLPGVTLHTKDCSPSRTVHRLDQWRTSDPPPPNEALQSPCESLPHGTYLPRRKWAALNRARCGVGRTRDNLLKWGRVSSAECPCGHPTQSMQHILQDCEFGTSVTKRDLYDANQEALDWLEQWADKI
ncbi:hypothetical protein Bbelb_198840 [Branchiostoma belcheri]|nr:hypothetical protein Bbelb_198840 [Branchiostoma belcheri]